MKNYTLTIRTAQKDDDPSQVKSRIGDCLLYVHPVITFRLGQASALTDDIFQIEVASDAKKKSLLEALQSLESKLSFRVIKVEWGWLISESRPTETDRSKMAPPDRVDSYASAHAQRVSAHTYQLKKPSLTKFIFLLISLTLGLAFFILLITILFFRDLLFGAPVIFSPSILVLALVNILNLVGLFTGIAPFPPWYVTRVACDQDGITIQYWVRPRPVSLPWKAIDGLRLSGAFLILQSGKKNINVVTGKDDELFDQPILVKTIIQRARLHFVEYGVYKRVDAA